MIIAFDDAERSVAIEQNANVVSIEIICPSGVSAAGLAALLRDRLRHGTLAVDLSRPRQGMIIEGEIVG